MSFSRGALGDPSLSSGMASMDSQLYGGSTPGSLILSNGLQTIQALEFASQRVSAASPLPLPQRPADPAWNALATALSSDEPVIRRLALSGIEAGMLSLPTTLTSPLLLSFLVTLLLDVAEGDEVAANRWVATYVTAHLHRVLTTTTPRALSSSAQVASSSASADVFAGADNTPAASANAASSAVTHALAASPLVPLLHRGVRTALALLHELFAPDPAARPSADYGSAQVPQGRVYAVAAAALFLGSPLLPEPAVAEAIAQLAPVAAAHDNAAVDAAAALGSPAALAALGLTPPLPPAPAAAPASAAAAADAALAAAIAGLSARSRRNTHVDTPLSRSSGSGTGAGSDEPPLEQTGVAALPATAAALTLALHRLLSAVVASPRAHTFVRAQALHSLAAQLRRCPRNEAVVATAYMPSVRVLADAVARGAAGVAGAAVHPFLALAVSQFVSVWPPRPADAVLLAFPLPALLSGGAARRHAALTAAARRAVSAAAAVTAFAPAATSVPYAPKTADVVAAATRDPDAAPAALLTSALATFHARNRAYHAVLTQQQQPQESAAAPSHSQRKVVDGARAVGGAWAGGYSTWAEDCALLHHFDPARFPAAVSATAAAASAAAAMGLAGGAGAVSGAHAWALSSGSPLLALGALLPAVGDVSLRGALSMGHSALLHAYTAPSPATATGPTVGATAPLPAGGALGAPFPPATAAAATGAAALGAALAFAAALAHRTRIDDAALAHRRADSAFWAAALARAAQGMATGALSNVPFAAAPSSTKPKRGRGAAARSAAAAAKEPAPVPPLVAWIANAFLASPQLTCPGARLPAPLAASLAANPAVSAVAVAAAAAASAAVAAAPAAAAPAVARGALAAAWAVIARTAAANPGTAAGGARAALDLAWGASAPASWPLSLTNPAFGAGVEPDNSGAKPDSGSDEDDDGGDEDKDDGGPAARVRAPSTLLAAAPPLPGVLLTGSLARSRAAAASAHSGLQVGTTRQLARDGAAPVGLTSIGAPTVEPIESGRQRAAAVRALSVELTHAAASLGAAGASIAFSAAAPVKTLRLRNASTEVAHTVAVQVWPPWLFTVEPALMTLTPNTSVALKVTFTPSPRDHPGTVTGFLRLRTAHGLLLERIALSAVTGPSLRVLTPAIDLGVCPLGAVRSGRVYVQNTSPAACLVTVTHAARARRTRAALPAHFAYTLAGLIDALALAPPAAASLAAAAEGGGDWDDDAMAAVAAAEAAAVPHQDWFAVAAADDDDGDDDDDTPDREAAVDAAVYAALDDAEAALRRALAGHDPVAVSQQTNALSPRASARASDGGAAALVGRPEAPLDVFALGASGVAGSAIVAHQMDRVAALADSAAGYKSVAPAPAQAFTKANLRASLRATAAAAASGASGAGAPGAATARGLETRLPGSKRSLAEGLAVLRDSTLRRRLAMELTGSIVDAPASPTRSVALRALRRFLLGPRFRVEQSTMYVPAGATAAVLVHFYAVDAAPVAETIMIRTNGTECYSIPVRARGGSPLALPGAATSLDFGRLALSARLGGSRVGYITLQNNDSSQPMPVSFSASSPQIVVADTVLPPGAVVRHPVMVRTLPPLLLAAADAATAAQSAVATPGSAGHHAPALATTGFLPSSGPAAFAHTLTVRCPGVPSQSVRVSAHFGPSLHCALPPLTSLPPAPAGSVVRVAVLVRNTSAAPLAFTVEGLAPELWAYTAQILRVAPSASAGRGGPIAAALAAHKARQTQRSDSKRQGGSRGQGRRSSVTSAVAPTGTSGEAGKSFLRRAARGLAAHAATSGHMGGDDGVGEDWADAEGDDHSAAVAAAQASCGWVSYFDIGAILARAPGAATATAVAQPVKPAAQGQAIVTAGAFKGSAVQLAAASVSSPVAGYTAASVSGTALGGGFSAAAVLAMTAPFAAVGAGWTSTLAPADTAVSFRAFAANHGRALRLPASSTAVLHMFCHVPTGLGSPLADAGPDTAAAARATSSFCLSAFTLQVQSPHSETHGPYALSFPAVATIPDAQTQAPRYDLSVTPVPLLRDFAVARLAFRPPVAPAPGTAVQSTTAGSALTPAGARRRITLKRNLPTSSASSSGLDAASNDPAGGTSAVSIHVNAAFTSSALRPLPTSLLPAVHARLVHPALAAALTATAAVTAGGEPLLRLNAPTAAASLLSPDGAAAAPFFATLASTMYPTLAPAQLPMLRSQPLAQLPSPGACPPGGQWTRVVVPVSERLVLPPRVWLWAGRPATLTLRAHAATAAAAAPVRYEAMLSAPFALVPDARATAVPELSGALPAAAPTTTSSGATVASVGAPFRIVLDTAACSRQWLQWAAAADALAPGSALMLAASADAVAAAAGLNATAAAAAAGGSMAHMHQFQWPEAARPAARAGADGDAYMAASGGAPAEAASTVPEVARAHADAIYTGHFSAFDAAGASVTTQLCAVAGHLLATDAPRVLTLPAAASSGQLRVVTVTVSNRCDLTVPLAATFQSDVALAAPRVLPAALAASYATAGSAFATATAIEAAETAQCTGSYSPLATPTSALLAVSASGAAAVLGPASLGPWETAVLTVAYRAPAVGAFAEPLTLIYGNPYAPAEGFCFYHGAVKAEAGAPLPSTAPDFLLFDSAAVLSAPLVSNALSSSTAPKGSMSVVVANQAALPALLSAITSPPFVVRGGGLTSGAADDNAASTSALGSLDMSALLAHWATGPSAGVAAADDIGSASALVPATGSVEASPFATRLVLGAQAATALSVAFAPPRSGVFTSRLFLFRAGAMATARAVDLVGIAGVRLMSSNYGPCSHMTPTLVQSAASSAAPADDDAPRAAAPAPAPPAFDTHVRTQPALPTGPAQSATGGDGDGGVRTLGLLSRGRLVRKPFVLTNTGSLPLVVAAITVSALAPSDPALSELAAQTASAPATVAWTLSGSSAPGGGSLSAVASLTPAAGSVHCLDASALAGVPAAALLPRYLRAAPAALATASGAETDADGASVLPDFVAFEAADQPDAATPDAPGNAFLQRMLTTLRARDSSIPAEPVVRAFFSDDNDAAGHAPLAEPARAAEPLEALAAAASALGADADLASSSTAALAAGADWDEADFTTALRHVVLGDAIATVRALTPAGGT